MRGRREVFGIAEDFEFDNQRTLVMSAWKQWRAGGYKHIPARQEVGEQEPAWIDDILFVQQIAEFLTNDSTAMQIAQSGIAKQAKGDGE